MAEVDGQGAFSAACDPVVVEQLEEEGGTLKRVGRFLGLVGDPEVVTVGWEEDGPTEPGRVFRSALLHLPDALEPGVYRVRLTLETAGRERMEVERRLVVTR